MSKALGYITIIVRQRAPAAVLLFPLLTLSAGGSTVQHTELMRRDELRAEGSGMAKASNASHLMIISHSVGKA